MAAPPETAGAPPPTDREEGKDRVQVCLFDESPDVFSRAVRAISELADGDPDPSFPDAEVQRIASSVTFLREWRHFSYEPKGVSFTCDTGPAPSRDDTHKINLSQFSSASVPQTTHMEDARDNGNSSDFILFAGGNVWALDWCPRLFDRPSSSINCEYLAVSAHPPGSSYHKIGMPLIGRGIIQIWCLVAPSEEVHPHESMVAYHKKSNRGRPRKNPDEISSVKSSSNPPKPRGRPRKRAMTSSDDHPEPSVKKPRGRPRKYPLAIVEVEDSLQNSRSQDSGVIDPHLISTVIPYDPAVLSVELAPKKGRGRPRKKQSDKIKCLSGIKLKEDLSMDPSRTALICIEPKKKRGRPRKYPAPGNSNHLLGTEAPKPSSEPTNSDNLTALAETNGDIDLGSIGLARCNIEKCNDHLRVVTSDATSPDKNQLIKPFVKIKGLSGIELKEDLSRDPSPTALICMEPKKQRGVPWKYPAPSYSKHLSGTEPPMPASEPTNSGNLTVLAETNGQIVASDLGSVGLARCNIEKCNVDLSVITSDATSTTHGLFNTKCKEEPTFKVYRRRPRKNPVSTVCGSTASNGEEQKTQIIPKSSDHVALVKNCTKESFPSMGRGQGEKASASIESSSVPLSAEVHNMISCTAITPSGHLASVENSMPLGSCVSEDLANEVGLVGYKNGSVDVGVMKMCESNTVNYPSDCNTENAQANQVVPVPFENSFQVIDELEDPDLAPFKESSKCDTTNSRAIAKDISLPRVVLCLAHNGKVAWDIKWKPPLENQSEQKSHLGFLAVLLGNGSIEVWEVPTPSMIQKIYSSSSKECTDPRFLKLRPVFRCAKVKCGNIQSIPLTVDWSPSPRDMLLAGCHDGTVALWKFSTDLSSEVSKPFMCVTAESAPIRTLSWAPYMSEENVNTFVTGGDDGLKFWDLRDPYRPLWELTTAPRAVLSLQWLKDARGIVISLEDGTLKFVSLSRIANDVPVTGKPFNGTKTQGVSTYQLSEYLIWSVHASETTGYAAYCVADGTAVRFQLTPRFWEKEPGRNRVPYFLCGSLSEEGTDINVGVTAPNSSLSNVPLVAKKVTKSRQDVDQLHNMGNDKLLIDSELRDGQPDGPNEGQETGAIVLADPSMQENAGICNSRGVESPESFEVFPPKSVALHRLRWNMNKGSERWLCYGGAAGIIRCQRI